MNRLDLPCERDDCPNRVKHEVYIATRGPTFVCDQHEQELIQMAREANCSIQSYILKPETSPPPRDPFSVVPADESDPAP